MSTPLSVRIMVLITGAATMAAGQSTSVPAGSSPSDRAHERLSVRLAQPAAVCGNGVIEPGEDCDGSSAGCSATATCNSNCRCCDADVNADGVLNAADLAAVADCANCLCGACNLPYASRPPCDVNGDGVFDGKDLDATACAVQVGTNCCNCGNGVLDAGEECDPPASTCSGTSPACSDRCLCCDADVDGSGGVDALDASAVLDCISGLCGGCDPGRIVPCDADGNGIVEDADVDAVLCQIRGGGVECCDAETPFGPMPESSPVEKNRFASVSVPRRCPGRETALRVELDTLAWGLTAHQGEFRYVNALPSGRCCDPTAGPTQCHPTAAPCMMHADCAGLGAFNTCDPLWCFDDTHSNWYRCATLGCAPEYRDWGTVLDGDDLHITGRGIVPSDPVQMSLYNIEQIAPACGFHADSCSAPSLAAMVSTTAWGNVDPGGTPGVTVLDVSAAVDCLQGLSSAPPERQCWLRDNDPRPDLTGTNIVDVGLVVDALKGIGFPYPGPVMCP